jgi:hypothetical protein
MKNLVLYIKAFLDRYIYCVPIILLLVGLITNFVDYNKGGYNYVVLGNSFGWSIFTSIAFYYFFNFKGKYCWFTRNAPVGLIIINLVDIVGYYLPYFVYSNIFNIVICLIIITLALIIWIKKKLTND